MDLSSIPAIDQHAHNVLTPAAAATLPFAAAFTEAHDPAFAAQTLCYRRSVREIAALLGCDPSEDSIRAERGRLGLEHLTRRCLLAASLDMILLDDGYLAERVQPIEWHRQFVPVRRLLRIETIAEQLIPQATDFGDFRHRFRAAIDPPPADVIAYKSIVAYRSGLAVERVDAEQAATGFARAKSGEEKRLTDKTLLDFLLHETMDIAAHRRLPLQLHTGFGDPDLDLRLANPLHLRPILEEPAYRHVPIVLLHASYPYVREASWLASVYSQVHVDLGLAVPLLSVAGMRAVVPMLLELAPTGKVLYSSDAHMIPELFYLAAKWARQVLGETLDNAIGDGDLSAAEADAVAVGVLSENARRLYRLPSGERRP